MKARKARKKIKARGACRKIKTGRKRKKGRHVRGKGTKAREHVKYVGTFGT